MKRVFKKAIALTLCAGLVMGGVSVTKNSDAAAKVKISKKSLSINVGESKKLTLKKGKKKLKFKKWKSSDKSVATVSKTGKVVGVAAGNAVVSAKYKGKKFKCNVTVNGVAATTTPTIKPVVTTAPAVTVTVAPTVSPNVSPTVAPNVSPTPVVLVDNEFDYAKDVTYEDTSKIIRVEFVINEETTSAEELKELGYEVSEDSKTAAKDTICEVRTYTFNKIPNTLRGLQTIPLTGEYTLDESQEGNEYESDGIGFNTMAATVCVSANFKGYSNPSDPFGDKDLQIQEMRKMYEYLNGPRTDDDISNVRWQTAVGSLKDATATNNSGNPNVYLSYFGARSADFYKDPGEGNYKLTVYRGPYMIPAKETITGKRPDTYMIFVGEGNESNDWGTDRYIDVWKSSDGNWYSWKDSFLNVTANNFKKAEEGF